MKKNICIVTGTRAEYSLLQPLIKKVQTLKKYNCDLIVTGTHLSKDFGNTISEIKKDNIKNIIKIKILGKSFNDHNICQYMSKGLVEFSNYIKKKRISFIIILGDRYELLMAATAAMIHRVKIVHIHGGEVTSGAYDDAIRHSISKMSSIHFVSHKDYKKRLVQLGEDKKNIFDVGGLGAYNISKINFLDKIKLEKSLKIKLRNKILLITFHSTTLEKEKTEDNLKKLIKSLKIFREYIKIFTLNNADSDSGNIKQIIKSFIKSNPNSYLYYSLGKIKYLSLAKISNAVIGNSSSGLLEIPSFNVPTINIGFRQKGRVLAKSVINCSFNTSSIIRKIKYSQSPAFKEILKKNRNPFYNHNTLNLIIKNLHKVEKTSLMKKFIDIK